MKNISKQTLLISLGTLVVGLFLGWIFFASSNETKTDKTEASVNESETIWTCSMHPQIRKSEAGQCPICGMDLIPLETTGGEIDPMAVRMSPTAMQLAQVQTLVISKDQSSKSIRLNGKVQSDERLLATQSSHIPGRVEKLMVNFTGEYIKAGQVIAYVYSPELVNAQEELLEANKIKATQPALFNAAIEKLKNWKLTKKQIDQVLLSNKTQDEFPILANTSGYITKKLVNPGDYIKQGEALFQIADLSKVWILFDVYESEMFWIKKGDSISYTLESLPGKSFQGKIAYIDPIIDPKTRVAKARVEANNADLQLKPEMFVTGILESKITPSSNSLSIPKTAVMWTGKRSVVYVMQRSDQGIDFRMREVVLGPELGDAYIIEFGLNPGEEIAVNGTFSIDAAAQLAGKPSMMNPEGGVAMKGHNHGGASQEEPSVNPAAKPAPSNTKPIGSVQKELSPLFTHYFALKVALSKDDFEKAKKQVEAIKTSLSSVDMSLFKGDNHTIWMEQSKALTKSLEHIEHLTDIKVLRQKFNAISVAMIVLAESFTPNEAPVYVQHCPMVNSNKGGNWLSEQKEILNPYFGKSMLGCGEITKTIR